MIFDNLENIDNYDIVTPEISEFIKKLSENR